MCAMEGCKVSARFNMPGEGKGKYCSKHKEPGMVDIVHPHCKVEGCNTLASFNISGHSRGEYCSAHKLVRQVPPPTGYREDRKVLPRLQREDSPC